MFNISRRLAYMALCKRASSAREWRVGRDMSDMEFTLPWSCPG